MKNNFVATFMLLLAGLIFNDVASVQGKPTKNEKIQQLALEGSDAIYRCYGTFSKREPEQCNKADQIKSLLAYGCDEADPIACKYLSYLVDAEAVASFKNSAKRANTLVD